MKFKLNLKNYLFLFSLIFASSSFAKANEKAAFWSQPRRGANSFNNIPLEERYKAAIKAGIDFLRITPSKWLNGRSKDQLGDFLLGRPGNFKDLVAKDVDYLIEALDKAHKAGVKIVLTVLSLPGNRWSQHNGGKQMRKIWQDFKYHNQSAKFWKQLAEKLKDHPAVVAYNIKNEPAPELGSNRFSNWYSGDYEKWEKVVKDTPQDINKFYRTVISAIRLVDKTTPIMIDSGFYATPWAFRVLDPVDDPHILYSFHMYEPYAYAGYKGNKSFSYPGRIPIGEQNPVEKFWDAGALSEFLNPVREWMKKNRISANQIVCGEFGVNRFQKGAVKFLDDQMKLYNREGWHWAFYTFREDDGGHAMDYELGTLKPGLWYWQAIERGEMPGADVYNRKSELWDVIRSRME